MWYVQFLFDSQKSCHQCLDYMKKIVSVIFLGIVFLEGSDQDGVVQNSMALCQEQQKLCDQVISYDCLYQKLDKKERYYSWKLDVVKKELALFAQFEKVHKRPHKDKNSLVEHETILYEKIVRYQKLKNSVDQKRMACLASMHSEMLLEREFILSWHSDDEDYDFAQQERNRLFNTSYDAIVARERKTRQIFSRLK